MADDSSHKHRQKRLRRGSGDEEDLLAGRSSALSESSSSLAEVTALEQVAPSITSVAPRSTATSDVAPLYPPASSPTLSHPISHISPRNASSAAKYIHQGATNSDEEYGRGATCDASEAGKGVLGDPRTFRLRGVPLDWSVDDVRSFLEKNHRSSVPIIRSLAHEIDGQSKTSTITFEGTVSLPTSMWYLPLPKLFETQPAREVPLDDNFYGITTLFAPPLEDHEVDVIAISGLGGHAFGSFKERGRNYMWLRDALPNDLIGDKAHRPAARVMIYGYESTTVGSRNMQNLEDLATSFHSSLLALVDSPSMKPIIFIAHSLGGLIVKQAIIALSKSQSKSDSQLIQAIYGLIFFGVPNSGMDITSLVPMIGDGPSRPLIDAISSINSQILTMQQREFPSALGGVEDSEMFCFYETLESPTAQNVNGKWSMTGRATILVTKFSATHCRPWESGPEHICAVARTHSDMVKFGPEDHEYSKVRQRIKGLARRASLKMDRRLQGLDSKSLSPDPGQSEMFKDLQACLRSLAYRQMTWRRPEVEEGIHESTCTWILDNQDYNNWLYYKRGLFWVKGKPGSGKSTLMAFIYQHLSKGHRTTVRWGKRDVKLEHFFMGRGAREQRSRNGMLRSLLHQLLQADEGAQRIVLRALEGKRFLGEAGKAWDWTDQELRTLFRASILDVATRRTVTILVDALDESGLEAPVILQDFHALHDELIKAGCAVNVRLCISCRHYPVLATSQCLGVVMEEHNMTDIKLYLDHRLDPKMQCDFGDVPATDLRTLKEDIASMASGVFLWVRLVVDMVEGQNLDTIRSQIQNLPGGGLDGLFENLLAHTIKPQNRSRALLLLQWISLAARPLTVAELRYAMASDHDGSASDSEWFKTATSVFEVSDSRMAAQVNVLSGGLAVVRSDKFTESRVQFIHESVKQYFLERGGLQKLLALPGLDAERRTFSDLSIEQHGEAIARSHHRLQTACLNYFQWTCRHSPELLSEIRTYKTRTRAHRKNWQGEHPQVKRLFLKYAVESLFYHAKHASEVWASQQELIQKLTTPWCHFRKWARFSRKLDLKESGYWHDPGSSHDPGSTLFHMSCLLNLGTAVKLFISGDRSTDVMGQKDGSGNTALHYAVHGDAADVVDLLLEAKVDPHARNDAGVTALELASVNGNVQISQQLLKGGANADQMIGEPGNVLQAASLRGDARMVWMLLTEGANPNIISGKYGSALQAAAFAGRHDIIDLLLDPKFQTNVNLEGGEYGTALQAAACKGHISIVDKLLGRDANVNITGGRYGSALQAASCGNYLEIVRKLLNRRTTHIDIEGGPFGSALQAASSRGHMAIAELLLQHGANININGGEKGSPLQSAIAWGHDKVITLLLDNQADINISREYGTILSAAARRGNKLVLQELQGLLERGVDDGEWGGAANSALIHAVETGVMEHVEILLLKRHANPNSSRDNRRTALHLAVLRRHSGMVKLLLSYGADVTAGDLLGSTPLHDVSGHRDRRLVADDCPAGEDERIAQILLEFGPDPNAKDVYGQAPLALAAAAGHVTLVELFVGIPGIDIETTDEDGATPLMRAICRSIREGRRSRRHDLVDNAAKIIHILLDRNANTARRDNDGNTLLHLLARNWDLFSAFTTRIGEIDVSTVNKKGQTALHSTLSDGDLDNKLSGVIEGLAKAGANINARDNLGRTPFLTALWHRCDTRYLSLLRTLGANALVTDNNSQSALHYAVRGLDGDAGNIYLLCESGIDVNGQDDKGNTALHLASEKGSLNYVEALLECGADREKRDVEGRSALHRAAGALHKSVVRILLKNGADQHAVDHRLETPLHKATYNPMQRYLSVLRARAIEHVIEPKSSMTGSSSEKLWWRAGREKKWIIPCVSVSVPAVEDQDQENEGIREGECLGFWRSGWSGDSTRTKRGTDSFIKVRMALERKPSDVARLLLEYNSSPTALDCDGKSALQKAVESGDPVLERMLQFPEDYR